jgi:uncharacterized protein YggL (DUF469 family)
MKKRLRKKFRTGEFTEFEFQVSFRLQPPVAPDAVEAMLGTFLDQIETQGLMGGGGHSLQGDFSFVVSAGGPRTRVADTHRQALEAWLVGHPALTGVSVGPLVDAWGPTR